MTNWKADPLLATVIEAARLMPRRTPAAGGASTTHNFSLEAAIVWRLDCALVELDAREAAVAASGSPPSPEPESITIEAGEIPWSANHDRLLHELVQAVYRHCEREEGFDPRGAMWGVPYHLIEQFFPAGERASSGFTGAPPTDEVERVVRFMCEREHIPYEELGTWPQDRHEGLFGEARALIEVVRSVDEPVVSPQLAKLIALWDEPVTADNHPSKLARISALMSVTKNEAQSLELRLLANAVDHYERRAFPELSAAGSTGGAPTDEQIKKVWEAFEVFVRFVHQHWSQFENHKIAGALMHDVFDALRAASRVPSESPAASSAEPK